MSTETLDPCLSRHKGNEQSNEAWNRVDALGDKERIMALYADGAKLTPKEVAVMLSKPLHTISGRFTTLKRCKLRVTGAVRDGSAELQAVEVNRELATH